MSVTYTLRRRDSRGFTTSGPGVSFVVAAGPKVSLTMTTGPRGADGPAGPPGPAGGIGPTGPAGGVEFSRVVGGFIGVSAGMPVALLADGVRPAFAIGTGQPAVGVAVAGSSLGFAATVRTGGALTLTSAEWDAVTGQTGGLTPGADYWLDGGFALGGLTTTVPTATGHIVQRVGRAVSNDTLAVEISQPILL